MCRIAGYLGAPVGLSALLSSPSHSLRAQAKAPRELPPGVIGSDGFGVGWFAAGVTAPARYRSVLPIWVDENVDTMAEHVRSSAIVASSRTASARMPLAISNTPPFVAGHCLLVHNGAVARFHEGALDRMRNALSAGARADLLGTTDSEYLAALLRDGSGPRLLDRVCRMLEVAAHCVSSAATSAQLNVVVSSPAELVVIRHAIGDRAPSLYVLSEPDGFTAASEPLSDAPGWTTLEPGDVVSVTRGATGLEATWSRLDGAPA